MGIFQDWINKHKLNEATPAGWVPSDSVGPTPLISAMMKIRRQQGFLPFETAWDTNGFQTKFGLSNEEMTAFRGTRLFKPADGGYMLDKVEFDRLYQALATQHPNMFVPHPSAHNLAPKPQNTMPHTPPMQKTPVSPPPPPVPPIRR